MGILYRKKIAKFLSGTLRDGIPSYQQRKTLSPFETRNYNFMQKRRQDVDNQYNTLSNTGGTGQVNSGSLLYNKMYNNGDIKTDMATELGLSNGDYTVNDAGYMIGKDGTNYGQRYSTMLPNIDVTDKSIQNINKSNFGKYAGGVASMLMGAPGAAVGELVSGNANWGNLNSADTQRTVSDQYGFGTKGADGRYHGDNWYQKLGNGAIDIATDPLTYAGVGLLKDTSVGSSLLRNGKATGKYLLDDAIHLGTKAKNVVTNPKETLNAIKGSVGKARASIADQGGLNNVIQAKADNWLVDRIQDVTELPSTIKQNWINRGTSLKKGILHPIDSAEHQIKSFINPRNFGSNIGKTANTSTGVFLADKAFNDGRIRKSWEDSKGNAFWGGPVMSSYISPTSWVKKGLLLGAKTADGITDMYEGDYERGVKDLASASIYKNFGNWSKKIPGYKTVAGNVKFNDLTNKITKIIPNTANVLNGKIKGLFSRLASNPKGIVLNKVRRNLANKTAVEALTDKRGASDLLIKAGQSAGKHNLSDLIYSFNRGGLLYKK
jgi:hypothetical protein